MFEHLFSPIRIGPVDLPNRICFSAHRTNFPKYAEKNITKMLSAYYLRRVKGGCGMIILGELSVHPLDRPWAAMIPGHDRAILPACRDLTRAIHDAGGKIFANLNHHGFQSSGAITRHACIGPSAVADVAFGETAKPMEPEDMADLAAAFANAAAIAVEGGFDGIEIDMGHASLLRQFLSPLSNRREDEYGGSPGKRMRLPLEVVAAVRKAAGRQIAIGIRLSVDEIFWGAITPEESIPAALAFEATGTVDFFRASIGNYYNLYLQCPSMHVQEGVALDAIQKLKTAVSLPVIGGYQIHSPEQAEALIADGQMDMAGMIRPLICDPDLPRKAKTGNIKDIRTCVRDNRGCVGRINQSKSLSCIQNPGVGFEYRHRAAEVNRRPKRIWVIGAGPAGLEAARASGARGHDVTLFEKNEIPGGQINLQVKATGRSRMQEVIRYLSHAVSRLDIKIKTGTAVTPKMVIEANPDAVIIATGAVPVSGPVPGKYEPPAVQTVQDILNRTWPVGKTVLFVDENGGHHAAAVVERLTDQGCRVDLVTSELFIGIDLAPTGDLFLTRQRLLQKGVNFITDTRVEKIEGAVVHARHLYSDRQIQYRDYDTIVTDMGDRADDTLYFKLKGRVKELYRVGDAVAPRGVEMAVFEGRKTGESL